MTAATDVLAWGRERARAGPWRGDGRTAYLAPLPHGPVPSVEFLRRCLDTLAARGYTAVLTSALSPAEAQAFLAVGFTEHERLRLLSHDLRRVPGRVLTGTSPSRRTPGATLRRGRQADWPQVLTVDASAFDRFWRLDRDGLDEAMAATPTTRFRVAVAPSGMVVGYAVSGRAGAEGYLQRLAVHPSHRRTGVGSTLVVDGLRWMRRWKVRRAVVNTQFGNDAALALYLRLGFVPEPSDLAVLRTELGP
jgi:ribosomal protein S18 acetylase RimI-like enzyme